MTKADIQWSTEEKRIAKNALKAAYTKEIETLIQDIRDNSARVSQLQDIWNLHDFLSAKRHDIDGKYDDREECLLFTLSQLVKDGLLTRLELDGLAKEKQAKIMHLSRM